MSKTIAAEAVELASQNIPLLALGASVILILAPVWVPLIRRGLGGTGEGGGHHSNR